MLAESPIVGHLRAGGETGAQNSATLKSIETVKRHRCHYFLLLLFLLGWLRPPPLAPAHQHLLRTASCGGAPAQLGDHPRQCQEVREEGWAPPRAGVTGMRPRTLLGPIPPPLSLFSLTSSPLLASLGSLSLLYPEMSVFLGCTLSLVAVSMAAYLHVCLSLAKVFPQQVCWYFPTSLPFPCHISLPLQQLIWTGYSSCGLWLPGSLGSWDLLSFVHLLSQIPWHRLGVRPASQYHAPKTRNMEMDSRRYQKIWQQWPRNHRIRTSPELCPLLASGDPFLFSPPDCYWIAQTIVIVRKEVKGQEVFLTLSLWLTTWPPFLCCFFFSSPCPHRYLSPKIAPLPDYQLIVSFSPWFKHFLTLHVINFLVLLSLPLKVFAHNLHNNS